MGGGRNPVLACRENCGEPQGRSLRSAMREAIEQFRAAIYSAGLNPPEIIEPDGTLQRFVSNGKPSDDAGWYVFHDDGIPAGAFGDWRGGLSETWRGGIGPRICPPEGRTPRA